MIYEDNSETKEQSNKLSPMQKLIKRIAIISWFVSHLVLLIGGITAIFQIPSWIVGLSVMIICWIGLGASVWTQIDYFENGKIRDIML